MQLCLETFSMVFYGNHIAAVLYWINEVIKMRYSPYALDTINILLGFLPNKTCENFELA